MKEIGSDLKEKREANGLSIEEVSEDLNVDFADIKNIEDGDRDHFKDINFLKELIQNYAKYLGIDGEKLLDQFNEYLFDQTSRISLEDIEKARSIKEEEESNEISSPYTIEKKDRSKFLLLLVSLVILFIVFFTSFFVVKRVVSNKTVDKEVSYIKLFGGK